MLKATDEQVHTLSLYESGSENIIVNSLAGTGKTTQLRLLDEAHYRRQPTNGNRNILYLVFNKRNADEALEPDGEGRSKFNPDTVIRTINSQGHRIWMQSCAHKVTLNKRKSSELLTQIIKGAGLSREEATEAWSMYHEINAAVGLAKALGYVPDGKYSPAPRRLIGRDVFFRRCEEHECILSPLAQDLTDAALKASIKTAFFGNIDYNDQVYMPALFGGSFPRFATVMVDEAQDLSPVNHVLLHRLTKNCRLVAVGDPWQSIYAFRGAFVGGMAELRKAKEMTESTLSVSFRCPEAVVRAVHWHVPQLRWFKTGGHVERLRSVDIEHFPDGCAIICRNNAPLLKLAFRILARRRSVSLAGSDVGPKVISIMDKLGPPHMDQASVYTLVEEWRNEKLEKGSTTADDIADCMRVFAHFGKTLGTAISYAQHIFSQEGTITLITGHKAKGLEWDTVYHLDPWLIKSGEQEENLRYVISTRSKNELFEIDSKDIR